MDNKSTVIFERNQNAILTEAASRYGLVPEKLKRLGSFESLVYEFNLGGKNYILKITHSIHRTPELVRGELDWTNYLFENGVAVSQTIPSINGDFLEIINGNTVDVLGDDYFLVYVVEKAEGKTTERPDWTKAMVQEWGRITGRMNALAKTYKPSNPQWKRFEWHEDDSLRVDKHIPASQPIVLERAHDLIKRMLEWPTDPDSYGLIHSDMHNGNFVCNNGRITAFDFDDSHYGWFGFEIMIPLFYVLRDHQVNHDDVEFARWFLGNFLEGYVRENNIDGIWIKKIPEFMKLREIDLYSVIHVENAAEENGWCRRFMKNRRQYIEENIPVIDMDFSDLIKI
jgi:Ser/Thr protein kinase RdoA (MazF antagonist)